MSDSLQRTGLSKGGSSSDPANEQGGRDWSCQHPKSRFLPNACPLPRSRIRESASLPAGTLLNGEIVIADESGHADFGALQQRLTVARRAAGQVALQRPAVLLVFDVLELGSRHQKRENPR
jgi:ATP-dependent DNA ligase